MRFYYSSIISLIFIAILYAVVLGVIWFVWVKLKKRKFSGPAAWSVIALVLVAPWLEEFWIAWNFGQLCRKDAGIVINKTVEVDGFYDDSGRTVTRIVGMPSYQFVESKEGSGFRRVERATDEEKDQAIEWFVAKHPGKELTKGKNEWIMHPVDKLVQVNFEIDTGYGWRITKLDKPTARYHFSQTRGIQVTHKVNQQSSSVIDSQTRSVLARYTVYSRGAPWFFIHLSSPRMGCDGPDGGPNTKYPNSFLIYRDVLLPISSK